MFSTSTLQTIYDNLLEIVFYYGPKLLGALFVWILGLWVIKLIVRALQLLFDRSKINASLKSFLLSLVSIGLKLLLGISALGMLGIEMTSFIALLGAAGLAFGMAMSRTLQNLAGGVILLIFKPFKVSDLIQSHGHTGTVKEIQIFVTRIVTPDNKTVILPNGAVANNEITNYATEGTICVDLEFGIAYNASIEQAKTVLLEVMKEHPRVLQEPQPFVGVLSLGDSAVNLAVRSYVKPQDYWEVYFDIYEQGKKILDAHQIEIPFPQRIIHQAK